MKKKVFGRKLKRDSNERKALFKGLLSQLVLHERIKTTEAKAKAVRGQADKLVTKAIKAGANAFDALQEYLIPEAARKLINETAPRFANRSGGYTRVLRIGNRVADNAQMVIMEWTETVNVATAVPSQKKANKEAKTTKPASKKVIKKVEPKPKVVKKTVKK
jgi:large subunit ribosomal protein L17